MVIYPSEGQKKMYHLMSSTSIKWVSVVEPIEWNPITKPEHLKLFKNRFSPHTGQFSGARKDFLSSRQTPADMVLPPWQKTY